MNEVHGSKMHCTEVVHILSSDDEEDKAATSVVTYTTPSIASTCSADTTLPYKVCHISVSDLH